MWPLAGLHMCRYYSGMLFDWGLVGIRADDTLETDHWWCAGCGRLSWGCRSLNGSHRRDRKSTEAWLEERPQTWSVLVGREGDKGWGMGEVWAGIGSGDTMLGRDWLKGRRGDLGRCAVLSIGCSSAAWPSPECPAGAAGWRWSSPRRYSCCAGCLARPLSRSRC